MGNKDIEVEVGGSSLEGGVYEPIQRILDLVRNVKNPSRYAVRLHQGNEN